jgi:hypothetical protein
MSGADRSPNQNHDTTPVPPFLDYSNYFFMYQLIRESPIALVRADEYEPD